MNFLNTTQRRLIRQDISDANAVIVTGPSNASTIVDYLDGNMQRAIANKMGSRYTQTIIKDNEKGNYYGDPMQAAKAAIDLGLFEIIPTGIFQKITNFVASLSQSSVFTYKSDGVIDDDFKESIATERDRGSFGLKLSRADAISVAVGSSAIHVQLLGNTLNYQVYSPDCVLIVFNNTIEDGGVLRTTNLNNINEASSVTLLLSSTTNKNQYVTYFGRSQRYPQGRLVRYRAKNWLTTPDPGDNVDYEHLTNTGELCNPFTLLQDVNGLNNETEYPVSIWYGNNNDTSDGLLPVNKDFYDTAVELDLANSRTMTSAMKTATGMVVFSKEAGASSADPGNLGEGVVKLKQGQSINIMSLPAANADTANKIITNNMAMVSETYGMPSYRLDMSKMASVPSGAALRELDKPANDYRQYRHEVNKTSMHRIFEIERNIARIDRDEPYYAEGTEQTWIVKDIEHETPQDKLNVIQGALTTGIMAKKEAVKSFYDDVKTDEEAINVLKDINDGVAENKNTSSNG